MLDPRHHRPSGEQPVAARVHALRARLHHRRSQPGISLWLGQSHATPRGESLFPEGRTSWRSLLHGRTTVTSLSTIYLPGRPLRTWSRTESHVAKTMSLGGRKFMYQGSCGRFGRQDKGFSPVGRPRIVGVIEGGQRESGSPWRTVDRIGQPVEGSGGCLEDHNPSCIGNNPLCCRPSGPLATTQAPLRTPLSSRNSDR